MARQDARMIGPLPRLQSRLSLSAEQGKRRSVQDGTHPERFQERLLSVLVIDPSARQGVEEPEKTKM